MTHAVSTDALDRATPATGDQHRMRVLHVVTVLDFGGVESHMALIGQARAASSCDHAFCAIGGGGRVEQALRAGGAQVDCLGVPAAIPSLAALRSLHAKLRRERPDVVHCHGAEANFHGLLAAWFARIPVRIGEEIGIPGHGRLARWVFRAVFGCAHAVIGVSGVVTQWLVRNREVAAARAVTLPNPVALPQGGGSIAPADAAFRMCFVGRLEPVKNLDALVAAFERLVRAGARVELWLVGEGSLRGQLERRVAEAGLEARVRFLGYQPSPDTWMRQCHAVVQPSLSEGFGLALVEGMGCGLPAITTAVGVAPDIVDDGRTGWMIEGFDVAGIAAAMERACGTPRAVVAAMGRAARERVVPLFEPADYLHRLDALYRALLPRGARA
jgi:glycosyltransferase involved in cell wall biosynthesis